MVENAAQLPAGPRTGWSRLRIPVVFVLGAALLLGLLVWLDPAELLETGKEPLPGNSEVLIDDAVRVQDPDVFHTKATLNLPEGGLLEFRYGHISDSGVHLRRMDRVGGRVVWEHDCAPLGVAHSEYEHEVVVHIEGRTARVISRGSYGAFVERLDLDSGRRLTRSVRKPVEDKSFAERVRGWLGLK